MAVKSRTALGKELVEGKPKKTRLEREGRTDTMFYRRAVAILAGKKDPLE